MLNFDFGKLLTSLKYVSCGYIDMYMCVLENFCIVLF